MSSIPGRESFTEKEWRLIQSLRTPAQVQRWFTSMPYNWEREGATLRSFRETMKRNEAHCLEAAVGAAVILEQHGYPPLLMDIESKDLLDHVVFVFQERGLWGAIGRSRDIGLHGRKPLFRSLRDLTWSYFDTYVDFSGRKSKATVSLISMNWETTTGGFQGERCQKLRTTCANCPIGRFALQTDDTKSCWSVTNNTRNVTRIARRLTMKTGASGCFEEHAHFPYII